MFLKKEKLAPNAAELGLLVLFLLMVPIYEAPKNIFLAMYFIYWFARRMRNSCWGESHVFFETAVWSIFGFSLLTTFFSVDFYIKHWSDYLDSFKIGLVGVLTLRTAWNREIISALLISVGAGIILAVLEGVVRGGAFPSLNSVGHINQVGIYLVIALAIFLGSLQRRMKKSEQSIHFVIVIFLLFLI